MNSIVIVGNLGADPESRDLNSGDTVCNLRVATDRRVKRGDEWVTETDWHRVSVFGKQAVNCETCLRKGSKVAVQGSLTYRDWEDQNGNKRTSAEIRAHRVEFLTPKGDRQPERRETTQRHTSAYGYGNDRPIR